MPALVAKIRLGDSEKNENLRFDILHAALDDESKAIQILEKSDIRNVESGFPYYNKGLAYEKLEDLGAALEFYRKAEIYYPDNSANTTAIKRVIKLMKSLK